MIEDISVYSFVGLAAVMLVCFLLLDRSKVKAGEKLLREIRQRQDDEWLAQVERTPWLRMIMEGDRSMHRFVLFVATDGQGRRAIVAAEIISDEEPREKVNWKKYGF
jgi:hypothetical protein